MKDYIAYSSSPFTSLQIVAELGLCYETVKKYLQALIRESYIKQIGKDKGMNVYIYNKHKDSPAYKESKQKHYTLEAIQETYRRQIAKKREFFDDLL
jgi:predicted transcriptional regulator